MPKEAPRAKNVTNHVINTFFIRFVKVTSRFSHRISPGSGARLA